MDYTTITVYSHTKEQMRERLLKDGWETWYNENYWVHPKTISNPKIQDYTNYGMTLEEAFMWDGRKMRPSILGILMSCLFKKERSAVEE